MELNQKQQDQTGSKSPSKIPTQNCALLAAIPNVFPLAAGHAIPSEAI
jgi:hypothetical protein